MENVPKSLNIRARDLMVLIYNLQLAGRLKETSGCDADRTLEQLWGDLDTNVQISTDLLERAMWACNELNELGKYWHPFSLPYDQLTQNVLQNYVDLKYNHTYNWIQAKGNKNGSK